MRVTAGLLKNRQLKSPKNLSVRPTSDKVRLAIFSSLGEAVFASRFLDMFCGTGVVGIEAYSRGASHITFVDKNLSDLTNNLFLLPKTIYTAIREDVFTVRLKNQYDIIYMDPPYDTYAIEELLKIIDKKKLLAYNGKIVLEDSNKSTNFNRSFDCFPFVLKKTAQYGSTAIRYLEYQ